MNQKITATMLAGMLSWLVCGDAVSSATVGCEQASDAIGPVAIETYTKPKQVDLFEPDYPRDQIYRNQEGWVHLNFMVDTEGKPFEITVVDAVGDDEFQDAAVRALERSRFEPATLDGVPIESGASYSYKFELRGGRDGARRRFAATYRRLLEAVETDDRGAADEALAELEADNLYENAYLEFGRFTYFSRWGTIHQQIDALRRAVGRDDATTYLPDGMLRDGLQSLFSLQIRTQDFGGALATATRLYELPLKDDFKDKLDRAVDRIEALRDEDRSIAIEGLIDERSYSWHLTLFQSNFHIDHLQGRLAEIKLRCQGSFAGFAYDEDLVYRVSDRYVPCTMELVGDPGTRFRVVQSPPISRGGEDTPGCGEQASSPPR